jgi:hypothetical protein
MTLESASEGVAVCVVPASFGFIWASKHWAKGSDKLATALAAETEKLNQYESMLRRKIAQNRAIANP